MAFVIGRMLVSHPPYMAGTNVLLLESYTDERKQKFHIVQSPLYEDMVKVNVPMKHVFIFKINGRKTNIGRTVK